MPDNDIPISRPIVSEEMESLVLQVLRSGRLAQGPMVEHFEGLVAVAAGTDHAIAVSSGTTALVASLEALQLQPGDEVVTSPFTFAATLNAILEAGATARFADIGSDFNVDPDSIAAEMSPHTRVIMPVHLYGLPADMIQIEKLARGAGVSIVEDAAQSIGADIAGRRVGSFGLGAFSFYATKNIATGEGGAVTTNDGDLAARIRILRNQGMKQRYEYVMPGHNYRMTELQAAIGIPQLAKLAEIAAARQANAMALTTGLADIPGLLVPTVPNGRTHVFNQFTLRVTTDAAVTRDQLAEELAATGIGTGLYYPRLVFDYACYRSHPGVTVAPVPEASRITDEVLSIPVHPALSRDDIDRIVSRVRDAFGA